MLVEWATHWSHTSNFEDFTIEASNRNGYYVPVNCLRYVYKHPVDGLFGCEIDQIKLLDDNYNLDYVRI